MPNRRMVSNRIANSANFLKMPLETQALYFHMILKADDDGVVEAYPLMRLLGVAANTFDILKAKGFIKQLNEDQVVIIMDWLEHNNIRADRKIDSIYKPLLKEAFPEIKTLEPKPRSDVKDNTKRLGGQSTDGIGKVRLGKVRLGKVRLGKVRLGKVRLKPSKEGGIPSEYGNKDINKLENLLKEKMNLETLDGTKKDNRQYCWLALKKFKGFEGVKEIIEAAANDEFWRKNLTDFKTLYYKAEKIKKVGKDYTVKEY